jgi:hypothetical protein
MDMFSGNLNTIFRSEKKGELILVVLMVLYLVLGFKTPDTVAMLVDNLIGKVVIIVLVIYLFMNSNPILGVLSALVAFELMRRSNEVTGLGALQSYAPTEEKKMSQFTAFNQFPYTLEQEVVAKMAPLVRSGFTIAPSSYKPLLDDLHNASKV